MRALSALLVHIYGMPTSALLVYIYGMPTSALLVYIYGMPTKQFWKKTFLSIIFAWLIREKYGFLTYDVLLYAVITMVCKIVFTFLRSSIKVQLFFKITSSLNLKIKKIILCMYCLLNFAPPRMPIGVRPELTIYKL